MSSSRPFPCRLAASFVAACLLLIGAATAAGASTEPGADQQRGGGPDVGVIAEPLG